MNKVQTEFLTDGGWKLINEGKFSEVVLADTTSNIVKFYSTKKADYIDENVVIKVNGRDIKVKTIECMLVDKSKSTATIYFYDGSNPFKVNITELQ